MNMPVDRPCTVSDCNRLVGSHGAKGMCSMHYKRWLKHGSTELPPKRTPICRVDGCNDRAHARRLCNRHYLRWMNYGTTDLEVPTLEDRLWERVDRAGGADACWLWTGYRDRKGYGQIGNNGSLSYTHRVAWEIENRCSVLPGFVVRHRCDNPPCCNPAHLELGTLADNNRDMVERRRAWWLQPHAAEVTRRAVATRRARGNY